MFYPALTEVQSAALRGQGIDNGLGLLFGTRDVNWSISDPLPLLLQPLVSANILWRTITRVGRLAKPQPSTSPGCVEAVGGERRVGARQVADR